VTPLLDVRHLSTQFVTRGGVVRAVDDVSWDVRPGETVALVGESGCGKSVSALSIMRLVAGPAGRITGGEVWFKGQDLLRLSEEDMRRVRGREIAMVFQEPMTSLNPLLTVGRQLTEGLEIHLGAEPARARARAEELLQMVGIPDSARRLRQYPHQFSGGMRQRMMIAMALACEPSLVLADEPTTALDVTIQAQILELMKSLSRRLGVAMLIITHNLGVVARYADRVNVMYAGRIIEQGTARELYARPRHPYTQRLVNSRPARDVDAPGSGTLVRAKDVHVHYPTQAPGLRGWFKAGRYTAVQSVDFDLAPGETLGVIGESGSGKTTLALAVLGLMAAEGDISIGGKRWSERAERRSMRKDIQVVFQDPLSSLSPRRTVEQIIAEGLEIHEPSLDAAARRERVLQALNDVNLTESGRAEPLLARYPHEFSGGQRQRIAIARALIVRPKVVVLDEPTSALDVTIQKQVLELLSSLQKKYGLSYILVTHDIDVVRAMAHRVMVMKDSRIVESGPIDQVLQRSKSDYTRRLVEAGYA